MIMDTDSEFGVFYDPVRVQAVFMDQIWNEIPAERFVPKNFDKIARCGRYSFYVDTNPYTYDGRRYCVVDRGVGDGSK